jgi:hypothetical protein
LDPQSETNVGHGARVAGNFMIEHGPGVLEERRGVLVLGEVDDAVETREPLGVKLEFGPALGSTQERWTPYPFQIAAVLQLTCGSSGFPRTHVSPLRGAPQEAIVVQLLEPEGIGRPVAGRRYALAGRQGTFAWAERSLARRQGARLGIPYRPEADRRRKDSEQNYARPFVHGPIR